MVITLARSVAVAVSIFVLGWGMVAPVAGADLGKGYLIGALRGNLGEAISESLEVRRFDGKARYPIYIEAKALGRIKGARKEQIRRAAEGGQTVVLIAPSSKDLIEFRKLLGVTYDIADTPGPLLAVRRIRNDYAEFSVSPVSLSTGACAVIIDALDRWQSDKFKVDRSSEDDIANNLVDLADRYVATRTSIDQLGFFGTSITMYNTPCYAPSKKKYLIYTEMDVVYHTNPKYTLEELKAAVNLYAAIRKRRADRPYSLNPEKRGWVGQSEVSASIVGVPTSAIAILDQVKPQSNGVPTGKYTYDYSYQIGGSVSFFDRNASLQFSESAGYQQSVSVEVDGGALINQFIRADSPATPRWTFDQFEPLKNLSVFPVLKSTSSWIWVVDANQVPGSNLPEPTKLNVKPVVESAFVLRYKTIPSGSVIVVPKITDERFSFSSDPGNYEFILPPAVEPAKPVLTALSSASAKVGTPVTVTGEGLRGVLDVTFGAVKVPGSEVEVLSDTEIELRVPKADGNNKKVQVSVRTLGGLSNTLPFTYK